MVAGCCGEAISSSSSNATTPAQIYGFASIPISNGCNFFELVEDA